MAQVTILSPLEKCTAIPVEVPTGGVTKGDVVIEGAVIGIVFASQSDASTLNGSTLNLEDSFNYSLVTYAPLVEATKATSVGFANGQKVYWNDSANNVTSVSGGNTLCGYAAETSSLSATTLKMVWDGTYKG